MRSPLWESSPGALAALLNAQQPLAIVDLYTIKLAGGGTRRWSGGSAAVVVNGVTWSLGPAFERDRVSWKIGVEVSSLSVRLFADSSITIAGTPLLNDIAAGGFDNARLQLDRAFAPLGSSQITGTLYWFGGRIADQETDRTQTALTVNSDLEMLAAQVPRDVYQQGCLNTLYDSTCGVSRAALKVTSTASSAGDASQTLVPHSLSQAAGYFTLGTLKFTSGANAGVARTIKTHTSSAFRVLNPFPLPIASGDAFDAYPGCDKQMATCDGKFSNLSRFRGMPFIPVAETVT